MWDLVSLPGIEPCPPALGAQNFSHCTTREVPRDNSEVPETFWRDGCHPSMLRVHQIRDLYIVLWASQVLLVVKNLPTNAGDIRDASSVSGLGWSSGGGHDNPLQYSRLENPMDRGAWQATVQLGSQRVGHNWSNLVHTLAYSAVSLLGRRQMSWNQGIEARVVPLIIIPSDLLGIVHFLSPQQ